MSLASASYACPPRMTYKYPSTPFSDVTSEAEIGHLAAMTSTVRDCSALLLMTSRIEGDPLDQAWRAATGNSPLLTMDLGPLRKEEAITLAGAFIDATQRFAMDCIERAEGNPLFLEQLVRNAEESGMAEIPASIQSLVLSRMDRLPAPDKRALQAASVIGQRFALDALRHLLDDVNYTCTRLIEHYLVRLEGDGYLFANALIQEGVYSSLLKAGKHKLHTRAAKWFAPRGIGGNARPALRSRAGARNGRETLRIGHPRPGKNLRGSDARKTAASGQELERHLLSCRGGHAHSLRARDSRRIPAGTDARLGIGCD